MAIIAEVEQKDNRTRSIRTCYNGHHPTHWYSCNQLKCCYFCVVFLSGLVGKQGVLHDPASQSVRQLQKMLSSLLQRAHDSPEGMKLIKLYYSIKMSASR